MTKRFLMTAGFAICAAVVVVSFQNCAGGFAKSTAIEQSLSLGSVVVSSNAAALSSQTSQQISFITGAVPPAATLQCFLDSKPITPCVSPLAVTLGDGNHDVVINVVNADQSIAASGELELTVDTEAPVLTLTQFPGGASGSTSLIAGFDANDATAGVASFNCELDGTPIANCQSPFSRDNLGEGQHSFSVQAVDRTGHVSPKLTKSWVISAYNPQLVIANSVPYFSNTSQSVSFRATSSSGLAIATTCTLDSNAKTACTSPFRTSHLAEGAHELLIEATDAAGRSSSYVVHWMTDLTPPVVTISNKAAEELTVSKNSVVFAASDSISVVTSCKCATTKHPGFASCKSPFNATADGEGAQTVDVRCTDSAGNTATSSLAWTYTKPAKH